MDRGGTAFRATLHGQDRQQVPLCILCNTDSVTELNHACSSIKTTLPKLRQSSQPLSTGEGYADGETDGVWLFGCARVRHAAGVPCSVGEAVDTEGTL